MAKLNCAILDDYQNIAMKMADWPMISDQVNIKTFNNHFNNQDELINAIKEFPIIIAMRERTIFGAALFNGLPNLKLLVTTGMQNAAIDLTAAAEHDVIVSGTKSLKEPPTELTWALLLNLAKNISQENNAFRSNGPWQSTIGVDIHGKTLGILGLGHIGSKVAAIGNVFGMKVMAWSQNLTQEKANACQTQLAASKKELLEKSDFISIHLKLSDRTKNLIDSSEFALMKPTAYLINTSRAQIVNQEALIIALQHHKIAGAAIDVFEIEPLPSEHIMRNLPNLLATPHIGYVTEENYKTYFSETVEDIKAYLDGAPIRRLYPSTR